MWHRLHFYMLSRCVQFCPLLILSICVTNQLHILPSFMHSWQVITNQEVIAVLPGCIVLVLKVIIKVFAFFFYYSLVAHLYSKHVQYSKLFFLIFIFDLYSKISISAHPYKMFIVMLLGGGLPFIMNSLPRRRPNFGRPSSRNLGLIWRKRNYS